MVNVMKEFVSMLNNIGTVDDDASKGAELKVTETGDARKEVVATEPENQSNMMLTSSLNDNVGSVALNSDNSNTMNTNNTTAKARSASRSSKQTPSVDTVSTDRYGTGEKLRGGRGQCSIPTFQLNGVNVSPSFEELPSLHDDITAIEYRSGEYSSSYVNSYDEETTLSDRPSKLYLNIDIMREIDPEESIYSRQRIYGQKMHIGNDDELKTNNKTLNEFLDKAIVNLKPILKRNKVTNDAIYLNSERIRNRKIRFIDEIIEKNSQIELYLELGFQREIFYEQHSKRKEYINSDAILDDNKLSDMNNKHLIGDLKMLLNSRNDNDKCDQIHDNLIQKKVNRIILDSIFDKISHEIVKL